MALCEQPVFIWQIIENNSNRNKNTIPTKSLESFLKEIVNWPYTKRIGLIITDNIQKAIHPAQNFDAIVLDKENIVNKTNPLFNIIKTHNNSTLLTWI